MTCDRHSSVGVIEHHELSNVDVVAKHDVTTAIVVMSALNKAFRYGLIRLLTNLLRSKHKTEMRVNVGSLLELSATIDGRSSDPSNVVTVVEQHAVEDFHDALAVESSEMEASHTWNSLEKDVNVGNTSLCLFHVIPKHLGCCKVVLEVCHDTIITDNNVAFGTSFFL